MAYLCSIFPILIVIAIVLDSCLYFNITDFPDGLQIFHTNRVVFGMTFGYQTNDRQHSVVYLYTVYMYVLCIYARRHVNRIIL